MQALPLTVTLAAAIFLGEAIGWRRIVAVAVGLIGVLLILRPGPSGFDIHALYALVAVFCVTVRDLVTRKLSHRASSLTVAAVGSVGVALAAGAAASFEPWLPVTAFAGWLLAGSAVTITGAYLLSVMVMRVGDMGFVAPFRYTGLVWAILLGLVFFG
ncbi:MAG: DMT family transporter, partial [Pseudomonadota bacterium]